MVIAFAAFLILPNFPRTTKWLSEEERQLAAWRLEEDIGEDDWISSEEQTFFHGMKLAFCDIKMWILVGSSDYHLTWTLLTRNRCSCYSVSWRRVR